MIGIWYASRGDTPAHWHEHVQRPDGTAFWAALSRCGMHWVVPSVLADIEAWRAQHPDAPDPLCALDQRKEGAKDGNASE